MILARIVRVATVVLGLTLWTFVSAQIPGQGGDGGPFLDPAVKVTFVHLTTGVPGALYEPKTAGEKARIGVFVMHASQDYLIYSACQELAKRGYRVLCANNTISKSGAADDGVLYKVMLEAKAGVAYLRKVPGVDTVVLFGHSGGATVMTAYQAIAEGGVKVCQRPDILGKCPDSLAGLPAADGVVLADANWGQAEMVLFSTDPAVIDEGSGIKLNPEFDLYDPKNGFNPAGATYSKEFIRKWQSAEGKRMRDLIKQAEDRVAAIEAGKGQFVDDEPFTPPGTHVASNKLFPQDNRLLSRSQKPWPLIHPDGSITTEIVHSVRVPETNRRNPTDSMRAALKTSVRNWLSSWAIRVTDDYGYDEDTIRGVVWNSTMASPPGNVENITVPFVTIGMTGHWEGLAAETIYNHAKSTDKTIAFVEEALHDFSPCTRCGKTPGQYGDTVKTTYDYIDKWLSQKGRFSVPSKQ